VILSLFLALTFAIPEVTCEQWLTARRAYTRQRLNDSAAAQLQLWADWVVNQPITLEAVDLACYRHPKRKIGEVK